MPRLVGLPEINYSGLRWLCKTEGLGERYAFFPDIFVTAKVSILSLQQEIILWLVLRQYFFTNGSNCEQ